MNNGLAFKKTILLTVQVINISDTKRQVNETVNISDLLIFCEELVKLKFLLKY